MVQYSFCAQYQYSRQCHVMHRAQFLLGVLRVSLVVSRFHAQHPSSASSRLLVSIPDRHAVLSSHMSVSEFWQGDAGTWHGLADHDGADASTDGPFVRRCAVLVLRLRALLLLPAIHGHFPSPLQSPLLSRHHVPWPSVSYIQSDLLKLLEIAVSSNIT
ncbi:hypothetical protein K402DRAFT_271185 [Aulographum hederae CBS 113979]|uniref:Uncharacterized protein n=1 Tax=Aulographum hederae CBS 113979 TaxID=1176131 RepID=A0A6G1H8J5_9PEZI|nr:hypothetical protein K402DRAFT_271185 [Aulographum hederae CBS 113979]